MSYETSRWCLSQRAASAIQQYELVIQAGARFAGSALDETVIPVASFTDDVLGVSRASHAVGDAVEVQYAGIAKAKAGASLGQGARVGLASGVGSSLGLVPVPYTGSAIPRFSVGRALVSAAAGDIFAVMLQAEEIV